MIQRHPIVGVMGSGGDPQESRAAPLGKWLASIGVHLLTGGGGGVMTSVSRAFVAVTPRVGVCIGILPAPEANAAPVPGYPNPWVEIPIRTHLPKTGQLGADPMSRNHVNILTSDVIVALPGTEGTRSEVELAVRYGRPVIAYVENIKDIAGLQVDVPTANDLGTVQQFVMRELGL